MIYLGEKIMKKQYTSPEVEIRNLTAKVFLEISGEATANDPFEDEYGADF